MKKAIKWIIGIIGFILFFILIDDSGVGTKERLSKIKDWVKKM